LIKKIKEVLRELDDRVLYGICRKGTSDIWDCMVIRKERIAPNGTSRLDHSQYISIRIVREDEIPEGLEFEVIQKMKMAGWKRSTKDITYDYTVDANEVVVEIATIEFVRPAKRVCV